MFENGFCDSEASHVSCNGVCKECSCSNNPVIKSPNFPKKYPENVDITWLIKYPPGQRIKISIISFSVDGYLWCDDYLAIYDGDFNEESKLGEYCDANSIPPVITSTTNKVYLHFHSDTLWSKKGFKLEYHPLDE